MAMNDEEFLKYCEDTARNTAHCNLVSVTLLRLAVLAGDANAVAKLNKQSVHMQTSCHQQVLKWVELARARIKS